jgi:hypothetical protein
MDEMAGQSDLPPAHAAESPFVEFLSGWRMWQQSALRYAGMPFSWLDQFAIPDKCSVELARQKSAGAVRYLLRQETFLAALTWQNPAIIDNWVGPYALAAAREPHPQLRRRDQREAKVANYAQRYCAKNDTIGFFGPVGWAVIDPQAQHTTVTDRGGPPASSVYLEVWAVERLAARWTKEPRLRPHLPVRLHPACSLHGAELRRPLRPPMALSPAQVAVLGALRPGCCVADLTEATKALLDQGTDPSEEISRLEAAGALRTGFTVPLCEHPEVSLAAQVERIGDTELRTELHAQLGRLLRARDDLAGVAQTGTPLRTALRRMCDTMEALTGTPAARDGQYGRVPVYIDSKGGLDAVIGASELDRLRQPLGLLLTSARWFLDQVAVELRGLLASEFAKLSGRRLGRGLTLADLQFASADVLSGAPGTAIPAIAADFKLRWAEVIGGTGPGEIRLTGARIAPLVAALFRAANPSGRPAWASARYHSPDLMLGYLDGPAGPPVWVLGELHMALNTLENRVFHTQGGAVALHKAAAADLPGGRILPLYPSSEPNVTSRTYPPSALHLGGAFTYWSYSDDAGHPSGVVSLPAADLAVKANADEVIVCPSGADWVATALEFLGEFITAAVVNQFRLREPCRHAPRVRVDDLVICRESWRLNAHDVLGARQADDYAGRGLRDLLAGMGVPRHAFYRTPAERKPSYVDLHAPLLLHNLDSAARRVLREAPQTPYIDVVEMLPAPGELWLADETGRRYTSELRIVAVDNRPAEPADRGPR